MHSHGLSATASRVPSLPRAHPWTPLKPHEDEVTPWKAPAAREGPARCLTGLLLPKAEGEHPAPFLTISAFAAPAKTQGKLQIPQRSVGSQPGMWLQLIQSSPNRLSKVLQLQHAACTEGAAQNPGQECCRQEFGLSRGLERTQQCSVPSARAAIPIPSSNLHGR